MSKKIQQTAKGRCDSAREREQCTRARAERNHQRGEDMLAQVHKHSAELQADAAEGR